jgi:hypothetical protein
MLEINDDKSLTVAPKVVASYASFPFDWLRVMLVPIPGKLFNHFFHTDFRQAAERERGKCIPSCLAHLSITMCASVVPARFSPLSICPTLQQGIGSIPLLHIFEYDDNGAKKQKPSLCAACVPFAKLSTKGGLRVIYTWRPQTNNIPKKFS